MSDMMASISAQANICETCYICQRRYMARHIEQMEDLFKALADKTRLRILGLLLTGEVCVCDIHESLKIPQPKTSRHLAYLRRAGLVDTRREGQCLQKRTGCCVPAPGEMTGASCCPPRPAAAHPAH